MSDRSWFFASQGQQRGPYPEVQLRDFIANGAVTTETLVWTEGMTGWQKAGEIPGLLSGARGSPAVPQPGGALTSAGGWDDAPLSIELELWSFLGRSLLFIIGLLLVIPAPWAVTSFYRWIVSRLRVPRRPNLAFTGQVGDIWYVFVAIGLMSYAGLSGVSYLQYILIPVQAFLSWMTVRWIAANFSSNGARLPIEFRGSALGYVGWYLLMYISVITIIGWAWVITAWMRWTCRNVAGTRREIVFNATGWQVLWRTVLFSFGCALLIPIPWVLRWYTSWYVSQFALVERNAYANP
jgi:GYF domain 2